MGKPRLRWTFLFAGTLQGISFLVDAYQILHNPTLDEIASRPWIRLVEKVGLDPTAFGPVCIVYGVAWIAVTIAVRRGIRQAVLPAVITALASLWYVVIGTGLAVIYLIALLTLKNGEDETGERIGGVGDPKTREHHQDRDG